MERHRELGSQEHSRSGASGARMWRVLHGRRCPASIAGIGCVLILVATMPGSAADTPPSETGASERDGHDRMVKLLAQVRDESRGDNAYVGESQVARLRADLDRLSGASAAERWSLLMQLGKHELRLGLEDQALAHYEKALEFVENAGQAVPTDKRIETLFAIGVAHVRIGETKNCAQRHTSDRCNRPNRIWS